MFFVLLRIAIGWHLAYEGCWKLRQDHWTAEGYLLASTGPLRPLFLKLVPDPHAEARLSEETAKDRMEDRAARAAAHYDLTEEQVAIFKQFLDRKMNGLDDEDNVRTIFASKEFQDALTHYREAMAILKRVDGEPPAGLELASGTSRCLEDMASCRQELLDYFPPLIKQLDDQVRSGHGRAIELAKERIEEKIADMNADVEETSPETRDALTQRIKAAEENLAELDKRMAEAIADKEDLPAIPVLKPPSPSQEPKDLIGLSESQIKELVDHQYDPDYEDLSWLTESYVNGLITHRYDKVLKPYYYFKDDRRSFLDDDEARAKYGEIVAWELVKAFEEYHQSIYGWRYREQKKIGSDRDTNYVAYLFDEPALPAVQRTAVEALPDDVPEDVQRAAKLDDLSDFEMARMDYFKLLEEIDEMEKSGAESSQGGVFDQERLLDMYKKKNAAKNALLARIETPLNDLDPAKMETFSEEMFMDLDVQDQMKAGPVPREPDPWWYHYLINWGNMLGLTIAGCCLMLGLFTRLSALAGAALITLYYMCMPPWPGLPASPMAEGHYFIVNKNLIEIIALLMIASSGVGRWFGLDGLLAPIGRALFGGGRRKEA